MRAQLAKLGSDSRFTFRGQFARYGYKRATDRQGNEHYTPTLLLTNLQVQDDNRFTLVTDHLWFNLTKGFQKLGLLKPDDIVQLNGRVNDYYKGYFTSPKQRDIKLSYPSKIKLVNSRDVLPLPAEKNAIIGLIMNLEWGFYIGNGRPIDDYYLTEFKSCPESKKYDYGVKAHTSAPLTWNTRYETFDDDYECDSYDDYDEYVDNDFYVEQQQHAYNNNLKRAQRGKNWLDQHNDLYSKLESVFATDKLSNNQVSRKALNLIQSVFEVDPNDSRSKDLQCRIMKNDIKLFFKYQAEVKNAKN